MMHEAMYYKKMGDGSVVCHLCPHECTIQEGKTGICRARINRDGTLIAATYGKTVSISLDPIEKKPLFHMLPTSKVISVGHNSCNLRCSFCQNFSISQGECYAHSFTMDDLVTLCSRENSPAVAFTYTEPTTWFEFILDASKALHEAGYKSILVSNGYINQEPLRELLPYIDAMNIDLKAITEHFYRDICGGTLQPVLDTIKTAVEHCLVEVTNLLITDENDSEEEIQRLVDFVAGVDPEIPLHFSRYYPTYKMTNPPTPVVTLEKAFTIAKKKLSHVYLGNVISEKRTNTYCPTCGNLLIARSGYNVEVAGMDGNRCRQCATTIHGIWK